METPEKKRDGEWTTVREMQNATRGAKRAVGMRLMGLIVVPNCPFCHGRHRYRNRSFGESVGAHCGLGTIRIEEAKR